MQQEIINHNNCILQTNLEINSLKRELDDLEVIQDRKIASLESKNVCISYELEALRAYLEGIFFSIKSAVKDLTDKTIKSLSEISLENERLGKSCLPRDIYKENLEEIRNNILEIRNEISILDKGIECKSSLQQARFNERFEKHKKELAIEPSVIKELRRELNNRINTSNVDITGIYEELQIQKKKQLVLEKECERLKTQLERIKQDK